MSNKAALFAGALGGIAPNLARLMRQLHFDFSTKH